MSYLSDEASDAAKQAGVDLVIQEPIFKRAVFNILVQAGLIDQTSQSEDQWLQTYSN